MEIIECNTIFIEVEALFREEGLYSLYYSKVPRCYRHIICLMIRNILDIYLNVFK